MLRFILFTALFELPLLLMAQDAGAVIRSNAVDMVPKSEVMQIATTDSVTYFVTKPGRIARTAQWRLLRLSDNGRTLVAKPVDLDGVVGLPNVVALVLRGERLYLLLAELDKYVYTYTYYVRAYDARSLKPIGPIRYLAKITDVKLRDPMYVSISINRKDGVYVIANKMTPRKGKGPDRLTVIRLDNQMRVTEETVHALTTPAGDPIRTNLGPVAEDGTLYLPGHTEARPNPLADLAPNEHFLVALPPGGAPPRLVPLEERQQRLSGDRLTLTPDNRALLFAGTTHDPNNRAATTGYFTKTFTLPDLTEVDHTNVFFALDQQSYGLTGSSVPDAGSLLKVMHDHQLKVGDRLPNGDHLLMGYRTYDDELRIKGKFTPVFHYRDLVVTRLAPDGTLRYVRLIPMHGTRFKGHWSLGGVRSVVGDKAVHLIFNDDRRNAGRFTSLPKKLKQPEDMHPRLVTIGEQGQPTERDFVFTGQLTPHRIFNNEAGDELFYLNISPDGRATAHTIKL